MDDRALAPERIATGIAGLDHVLHGGFPANRLHLIQGSPGTGKTTLAMQFLLEGVRRGEPVLYVTLSETVEELREVAASHGWSLDGVAIREMTVSEEDLRPQEQYTILHPEEVELTETTWAILQEVERTKPSRVVFDSLGELRLLARDRLRYRRQILGMKQFFAGRHCTVLLLDEGADSGLESIAHSVINLEQLAPQYGVERRRLRVVKVRGSRYRGGYHDLVIRTGGVTVFPRLVAAEHREPQEAEVVPSGVPELDQLLGGGLHRGTSALVLGPAGVGKTALCTQYAAAAAARGERAEVYLFDESIQTFLTRSDGLGMNVREYVRAGRMVVRQLDPTELSPGEFDQMLCSAIEERNARVLVIDSLNGYLNAMAEERLVLVQLHELLTYLGQKGALTLMTVAQHGLFAERQGAPLDVSYLADSVVLLRYFEAAGQLRQAISAVKKRTGAHEHTIREYGLGPGIRLGQPLHEFQGVLAGSPSYLGAEGALLSGNVGSGGHGGRAG